MSTRDSNDWTRMRKGGGESLFFGAFFTAGVQRFVQSFQAGGFAGAIDLMPCAIGTSSLTLYLVLKLLNQPTSLNELVYCCWVNKLGLTMVDMPTCLGIHDP